MYHSLSVNASQVIHPFIAHPTWRTDSQDLHDDVFHTEQAIASGVGREEAAKKKRQDADGFVGCASRHGPSGKRSNVADPQVHSW